MIPRTTAAAACLAIPCALFAALAAPARAQGVSYNLSIGSEYRTGETCSDCRIPLDSKLPSRLDDAGRKASTPVRALRRDQRQQRGAVLGGS